MAATLNKILVDSRPYVTRLHNEIIAIEGFEEEFLAIAFDYCCRMKC